MCASSLGSLCMHIFVPGPPPPRQRTAYRDSCWAGILPGSGIHPSDRWYGQQAVYRLSMGNFVRSPPPEPELARACRFMRVRYQSAHVQINPPLSLAAYSSLTAQSVILSFTASRADCAMPGAAVLRVYGGGASRRQV